MASIEPTKFVWTTGPDGERQKKPARETKWRARFRDPRGRARSKVFDRKADAARYLERVGSNIQAGAFSDPALQRTTFEEWAEEWLAGLDVRPTTLRGYRQALDRIRPEFEGRRVGTLDRATVRRFVAKLRRDGYSPKTIRATVSVLKTILDLAVEARALLENPATRQRVGTARQAEPLFFTPEQISRLAEHTEAPFDVFVLLDAYTGLRPSEVCGLRVRRLDLMRGRVEVAEVINDVNGKAMPGPTKTCAKRRVPMPPSVRDLVARHLEWRKEQLGRDLRPDDYVFAAPKGGLLRVAVARKLIRRGLEAAGLPVEFRTYDLRHSCASMLIAAGAHPRAIMERLGHSSITTTLDVYGHLFPALEADLTERLEDMYRLSRDVSREARQSRVIELPDRGEPPEATPASR